MYCVNRIGGVMVSLHASSAADREFELRSGQTSDAYLYILQQIII